MTGPRLRRPLAVVVVTHHSEAVLADCLDSVAIAAQVALWAIAIALLRRRRTRTDHVVTEGETA